MDILNLDNVLVQVRAALEKDDVGGAVTLIEALRSPDQADLFSELDDEHQVTLLPEFAPAQSADILEKMDDGEAADLVTSLPAETVIRIVDEMEPDEAADLLGDLQPSQAQEVLAGLETAEEVLPLMGHADDSAGGLMTSGMLTLRRRMTAADALRAVRSWKPEGEAPHILFVVDENRRLCGEVDLHQLVTAEPATLVRDLMDSDLISVPAGTDQEECARIMSRYDLLALPVVDATGGLLGVVTIDDVIDVLVSEATEDIQRLGGAQPLEHPYLDTGILAVFRKRIGWLLILFVTESLTGSVLRHFENELQTVVALAYFVPLLIGTGGNAGSQTTSTIIRALAVGEIDLADAMRALWHELRTGLMLGVAMCVVAYVRALTWGSASSLALTVAVAVAAIVIWANALGSLLPLLAVRLRIDPAVVSGPVMSTLVDATGLYIYFTVARVVMGI